MSTSTVPYLDRLAQLANGNEPEGGYRCTDLVAFYRYAVSLEDRGVGGARLLQLSRLYARRLDELGAVEFDHRCLVGL
jgi:hypothetical protein